VLAVRIEGGVLLGITAGSGGASKTSIVAAVNTDGSKRWVRCIDGRISGVWAAPPPTQPRTAIVAVQTDYTTTGPVMAWPIVSLVDGSDQGSVADAAAAVGIDPVDFANHWQVEPIYPRPPSSFVVRHLREGGDYSKLEEFALYDLVTNRLTVISVPSEIQNGSLGFSDAEELVLTGGTGGYQVLAVFRDGAWSRDPSVLRKAFGVRAIFGSEQPSLLVGIDATGKTVWTDNGLASAALQGTFVSSDGGVSVADVCTSWVDVGNCTEYALAGVNTDNGEILWALPGFRLVSAHSNGYLLTTDGSVLDDAHPRWVLLDDKTGKPVDKDQQWADPDTFRYGCCGESETVWVDHAGGVVVAVNNTRVSIWYPKVAAGETHKASIP
jgi:hypothetical protein